MNRTTMLHLVFCALLALISATTAWAFTSTDLQTELVTDPASLGCYAGNITTGNDLAIQACINLVRAGAGYVVSRGTVTRNTFVGDWGDVIQLIPSITDTNIRNKWTWMVQTLLGFVNTIDLTSATATGFFAQMVSDGLQGAAGTITSTDVTARTTRQGSRAEVLWGPGTVITLRDISLALRNSQ